MTNKTLFLICVIVLLAACVPTAVPTRSELEQSIVIETAVVATTHSPQNPTSTATSQPVVTVTPLPTLTPEKLLPATPTTSPPDACPPDQPDSIIQYSPDAADYRGKQFAELPAGWEDWGGYAVGNDQYGQYLIRQVEQQGSLMLWLEKVVCRHYYANYSSPHLEIADVLFLPLEEDTGNGARLIESTCWKAADYPADSAVEEKERWVDTLLAIGHFEDYYNAPTEILFAWEINLEAGRFEELSPETVACTGILGL